MEILLFVAVFGSLLALVLFSLYQRARQVHALVDQGIPIQGIVTNKRRFMQKGRLRFVLTYEYHPDGKTRQGRSVVSREQFESHSEGQALPLRYRADKPSVSAPEFVLEQARRAQRNGS
jgi:hypothetical protein